MFDSLRKKIINWCFSRKTITINELRKKSNHFPCEIFDNTTGDLKFIEQSFHSTILVETPTGFSPIKQCLKTVDYNTIEIRTMDCYLKCALEHVVILDSGEEIFAKYLFPGISTVRTKWGDQRVLSVSPISTEREPLFDLELDDENHTYYTNDILSHNSWTSAAYLLWFSVFQFDKTILIASNKNDNAMEMIHRCKYMYERMGNWLKPGITDDYSKHSIGFDNGSRILSTATSESSGRGFAISLLFLDEFAFVRDNIQDAFWTSISPTLATGGDAIIASTPNGDINIFAQLWRGAILGNNGFFAIQVLWNEPPDRDEEFKRKEIGKIGILKWNQEYECQFISNDKVLIDARILNTLVANTKDKVHVGNLGEVKFFKEIVEGGIYLVGVDPSTGVESDYAAFEVFSFPALEQIAEYRTNDSPTNTVYNDLTDLLDHIDECGGRSYFSIENNGIGEGMIALYEADEELVETAELISEEGKKRLGMTTTAKSKKRSCIKLKEMIESGKVTFNSRILVEELKHFARKGASYEASPGATDDSVSAFMIILRILEEICSYEDEAWHILYTNKRTGESIYQNSEDVEDVDYEPLPFI